MTPKAQWVSELCSGTLESSAESEGLNVEWDVRDPNLTYKIPHKYVPNHFQTMLQNSRAADLSSSNALEWQRRADECMAKGMVNAAMFCERRANDHESYAREFARYAVRQFVLWYQEMQYAEV